jgi:hypothetical protein
MAIQAQLFDGTLLEFPDGTDPSVIEATAKRMTTERQAAARPQKAPENVGFFEAIPAALGRGFESFGEMTTGLGLAGKQITGQTEEVRKVMAEAKKEKPQEKPGMTVADFERIAAEQGFAAAAAQAPKYIVEQVLQSAPQMATPIAVGAAVSPFLSPVGGAIAGIATYGVQQFGNFLMRQAQEKQNPEELELTKAALTAGGTAPIGYFADRFTLGLSSLGKAAGEQAVKELAARRVAGEIGAAGVAKGVAGQAAKGATLGIIAEAPTEVLESVAERYQAGLSLSGEDALNEYKESFFGAAAAGAGLGAGARGAQAYGGYRGEAADLREQARAAEEPTRRSAIDEADEYESTGTIAGAGEPSVSMPGEGIEADTGIAGTTAGDVGGAGIDTGGAPGRTEALDNQLNELRATQAQYAKFDPADPRINEIEDVITELQSERKATSMNAPGAETTSLTAADLKQKADTLFNQYYEQQQTPQFETALKLKRTIIPAIEFKETQIAELDDLIADPATSPETKAKRERVQAALKNELQGLQNQAAGLLGEKATALNAPSQEGFDFTEPDETTQRILRSEEPTEFALTPPSGTAAAATEIEPIVEPERAKMMLIGDAKAPMKPLTAFFNSLKPATVMPEEVQKFKSETRKLLDDVAEFIGGKISKEVSRFEGEGKGPDVSAELTGPELDARLNYVRDFFDTLSIAPKEREALTSALSQRFAGMSLPEQTAALEGLTSMPKLNTRRGITELREKLAGALSKYERKRIGQEETALPYKLTDALAKMDPYIVARISKALKALKNTDPSQRTPEEKAAYAYFGPETGWSYTVAMRSAAFDIGSKADEFAGVLFKGQDKTQAELFKDWVADNLPQQEYRRFEATVADYKRQVIKAEEYRKTAEKLKKEGGVARKYFQSVARAPSGKVSTSEIAWGKGPGKVSKVESYKYYPMHPAVQSMIEAGDVNGALKILAKQENRSKSAYSRFTKHLAQKLIDMNLNTTVLINQQDRLVDSLLTYNIEEQRAQFYSYVQQRYPEVFDTYFSKSDPRQVLKGLQAIKSGEVKVDTAPLIGQFDELLDEYQRGVATLDSSGSYLPYINTVNLNFDMGGGGNYTFMHEMMHAATAYALNPVNYNKLTPAQQEAVTELKALYEFARRTTLKEYGFTNLDEFVAEAFSNPAFQDILRDIPYEGKAKSLWDKFTEFVSELFGLNNVLGYTLANANVIMEAPSALTGEAVALNARGRSSRSVLNKTMPTNPGYMGFMEKVFGGRPTWGTIGSGMADLIDNVNNTARKYYLGGFTLRQLNDMIGYRVPQFRTFIDKVESMLDDRNRMLEDVRKITDKWMKWQGVNPEKAKVLNGLMLDATLQGKDPAKGKTGIAKIDDAYEAIGDDGRAIYRQVRDHYAKSMADYINSIVENRKAPFRTVENRRDPKYAVETKLLEANPEIVKIRQHFAKHKVEPYFPIRRFGRFSLQLLDQKQKEFYMFESAGERKAFMKTRIPELEKKLGRKLSPDEIKPRNGIRKLVSDNLQDFTFLSELKDIIQSAKGPDIAGLKDNLEESLEQLYFLTLPDQSVRKMFMNRKGTAGMDTDMLRAFTSSAFHMAYQQSRYKVSRGLYSDLDSARKDVAQKGEEGTAEAEYLEELEKRLSYIMNPTDTGAIPSFLSNTAFIWFMTSPASAIVNMLGVPAVGMPVVSAKFGWGKTTAKMGEYAKKFASTGFRDKEGNRAFPSLNNKPEIFNPIQQAAYDQFISDGLIDITLSHDLVGQAEAPSNLYTGKTQTAMKWLSGAFHGAEKFNREIVAMSSFDLAYEKAKADGYTDAAAFRKAVDTAKDLTYKSMFDYSTLNKPRYFQQPAMKVILQFKQFSQQMTYLLARSAYDYIGKSYSDNELKDIRYSIMVDHQRNKPDLPELTDAELDAAVQQYVKDVRTEARDRLAGTLGMTAIFAGASGLPMWWAVSGIMNTMHAVFGDDEEEWDFDNWFKNWTNATFGGFVGDSISRGVVSQTLGADVASRLSLNDMWYRDSRKSPDEVTAVQNMMVNLLGPSAGLLINAAEATKQYNDGHIQRALETATPAVIKNALKGIRLGTEGRATTLKGNELVGDITGYEALIQGLGFSPERLAQRQKSNIEMKNAEQKILNRRQALLDGFFMSVDNGDDDMRERVIDKVAKFNAANPGVAITGKNLTNSINTRFKLRAMAEATGGMSINKKLIGQLQDMADWGNPE